MEFAGSGVVTGPVAYGLIHAGSGSRAACRVTGRLVAADDPGPDWALFGTPGDAALWLAERGYGEVGPAVWAIVDRTGREGGAA